MELKEFIVNTIGQIADGVQDAIAQSNDKNYLVNPSMAKVGATYEIRFDLSVETGQEGSAGIKILNGSMSERSVNKITFTVNMTYPTSGDIDRPKRPV